jgi:hypothetical protein
LARWNEEHRDLVISSNIGEVSMDNAVLRVDEDRCWRRPYPDLNRLGAGSGHLCRTHQLLMGANEDAVKTIVVTAAPTTARRTRGLRSSHWTRRSRKSVFPGFSHITHRKGHVSEWFLSRIDSYALRAMIAMMTLRKVLRLPATEYVLADAMLAADVRYRKQFRVTTASVSRDPGVQFNPALLSADHPLGTMKVALGPA